MGGTSMYLSNITIENFRCFGESEKRFESPVKPGLTALVGENDAGKTAVIDALRFALGTTDQEWYRLDDTDFHREDTSRQIRIVCRFEGLTAGDNRAFVEYLTYRQEPPHDPVLYVSWTAKDTAEAYRGRPYRRVEVCSGEKGDGPTLAPEVRELLRATYLRPLRNAEHALSAGRGSRLSQVLYHAKEIKSEGRAYAADVPPEELNVLGIADLANVLLEKQRGVADTRENIEAYLEQLWLLGQAPRTSIAVHGSGAPEEVRLRQLLEKLDLVLGGTGKPGLGSSNLLFIACELLLLAQEGEGNRMLLIEEPEAHLHPQRQLRVMEYLQNQALEGDVQIIVSTHSPNLASVIELDNLVMVQNGRAFSLSKGKTKLAESDYRFLQRFLDVTKANLFFARGVMIVEGDAENILVPTLASLLGRDFTEHGVSVVNVGGVGLRRYARIFQRSDPEEGARLDIPVACVTDMDVMPDCAPVIIGKVEKDSEWPELSNRRWRAKKDFADGIGLDRERAAKDEKATGQRVRTFVSDEWTLEYDLALGPKDENGDFRDGLSEDVFVAACLAAKDDAINAGSANTADIETDAREELGGWEVEGSDGCTAQEVLASMVYAEFAKDGVSKAIAAQYLAEMLRTKGETGELPPDDLRQRLPTYLTQAIDYVTGADAEGYEAPAEAGDQ